MTHKKKPTAKKIESTLPIDRIIRIFETRFIDPYNDSNAILTTQDFVQSFPDIPHNHVEEALIHYAEFTEERILFSKLDSQKVRVWYIKNPNPEIDGTPAGRTEVSS